MDTRHVDLRTTDGRAGHSDVEVAYRVAGEGPPVVLLHGIGLDSATVSWRHAIPALAEDRRVYAPDLPGHGDSGRPRVRYTHEYYLDVVSSFLEALDLEGAPLVGISMGGGVALGYALAHDVERLALVDSYGLGRDAPWRPAASGLVRVPGAYGAWWRAIGATRESARAHLRRLTGGPPSADLVDDVLELVRDGDARALSSWHRSEFRPGGLRTCYRDRLSTLDVPTLFVHGREDPLFPARWSERAAAETGGRLEIFEDCGHWPPREAPGRFNEVLAAFLADGSAA